MVVLCSLKRGDQSQDIIQQRGRKDPPTLRALVRWESRDESQTIGFIHGKTRSCGYVSAEGAGLARTREAGKIPIGYIRSCDACSSLPLRRNLIRHYYIRTWATHNSIFPNFILEHIDVVSSITFLPN